MANIYLTKCLEREPLNLGEQPDQLGLAIPVCSIAGIASPNLKKFVVSVDVTSQPFAFRLNIIQFF